MPRYSSRFLSQLSSMASPVQKVNGFLKKINKNIYLYQRRQGQPASMIEFVHGCFPRVVHQALACGQLVRLFHGRQPVVKSVVNPVGKQLVGSRNPPLPWRKILDVLAGARRSCQQIGTACTTADKEKVGCE